MEHDPCLLLGDFNASIEGGRTKYARTGRDNPTTIADASFTTFVETTKGTILPPVQVSWRNPFREARGQGAKLDFTIIYNFEEEKVEGLEKLSLSKDIMLTVVNEGPWRQTIESHLVREKQLLEDITTKQIRANTGKEIQHTPRDFMKEKGPDKYSKEENT